MPDNPEFPPLIGTPSRVRLAERVRRDIFAAEGIELRNRMTEQEIGDLADEIDGDPVYAAWLVRRYRERIQEYAAVLLEKTAADWWISNEHVARSLLRKMHEEARYNLVRAMREGQVWQARGVHDPGANTIH